MTGIVLRAPLNPNRPALQRRKTAVILCFLYFCSLLHKMVSVVYGLAG